MRDGIAGTVRPVMCGDKVARQYEVETVKKILRVIRTLPLRQPQFHVDEKIDAPLYVFQGGIRSMHVAGVQYGDVLFRVRHQISARWSTRVRIFPAFDCLNLQHSEVCLEWTWKLSAISSAVVEMLGVKHLNFVCWQILCNWEITLKGGVSIVFINRQYGVNAAGANEEFLESLAFAEL